MFTTQGYCIELIGYPITLSNQCIPFGTGYNPQKSDLKFPSLNLKNVNKILTNLNSLVFKFVHV